MDEFFQIRIDDAIYNILLSVAEQTTQNDGFVHFELLCGVLHLDYLSITREGKVEMLLNTWRTDNKALPVDLVATGPVFLKR